MALTIEIPGREPIELQFLLLDVNGTLSDRGALLPGVAERLDRLRDRLEPRLLSADTYGTLAAIADQLAVPAQRAASGAEKLSVLRRLGPTCCVVVGNGSNDASILAEAALGIAVVGPEGASAAALSAADVICASVLEALDLIAEPRALAATLRS
jgi:soluble P-type ATPase